MITRWSSQPAGAQTLKNNPQLGLKSDGSILALELAAYSQGNWDFNGADSVYCCTFAQSAYNIPSARITPYGVRTHTAKPTAMRAPGNVNQHALMETIMEHAAAQTGLSPHEVRLRNLIKQGDPVMPPNTTLGRKYPYFWPQSQVRLSSL